MIKINGEIVDINYFPDGTFRLEIETKGQSAEIQWLFEKNEELFALYLIANHLREVYKIEEIILKMPYIPNARMDRVKHQNEVFTLKYFCEFINSMNFNKVVVRDAHSNVSLALLNNVVSEEIFEKIKSLANKLLLNDDDLVFFPDEGASKRYAECIEKKSVFGIKKRNWETGKIEGLDVYGDIPENGFNVLIIDDISSYGGTFYHSAKRLKELGAEKIWLYVTHCENSILDGELIKSNLINKIYTTESIFTEKNPNIEVI